MTRTVSNIQHLLLPPRWAPRGAWQGGRARGRGRGRGFRGHGGRGRGSTEPPTKKEGETKSRESPHIFPVLQADEITLPDISNRSQIFTEKYDVVSSIPSSKDTTEMISELPAARFALERSLALARVPSGACTAVVGPDSYVRNL